MTFRRKLYRRFLFLVFPLIVISGLFTYWVARRQVVANLAEEGVLVAGYQAERIRNSLAFVETTSEYLTKMTVLTDLPADRERFQELLKETLNGNLQLSAIEIKGIPGGDSIRFRRTEDGAVTAAKKPLFTNPDLKRSIEEQIVGSWIIPTTNNKATHIYHIQSWTGVQVIMEVPIRRLAKPLGEIKRGGAYGFLAMESAVIFTDTIPADVSEKQFTEFCANVCSEDHRDAKFYRVVDPLYGEKAWVGTSKVGDLPMVAGVVFLESRNFDPFNDLGLSLLATTFLGLLLASGAATSTAELLSRPLSELSAKVTRLKEGRFDRKLPTKPGVSREIQELTDGFNRMLDDLQSFVHERERAAASRQALESELEVASRIQTSIQPGLPFQNEYIQAVGFSYPARQVGGDFLGVFPVKDGSVGFFVGDVSGKGIPAAIYMAFTAGLLEYLGRAGWSPADCLREVNRALAQRGEKCMFCTCVFGVLGTDGLVHYCNAGHHPPILYGGGWAKEMLVSSGLPLGVMDTAVFETGTFRIEPGCRLLFYTDGLTEAMNNGRDEFGLERLKELMAAADLTQSAEFDLRAVEQDLSTFRAGEPANDDVTLLVLQCRDRLCGRRGGTLGPEDSPENEIYPL